MVEADQEPAAVGPYRLVLGMRQGQEAWHAGSPHSQLQRPRAPAPCASVAVRRSTASFSSRTRHCRSASRGAGGPLWSGAALPIVRLLALAGANRRLRRDPSLSGSWGKHRKPGVGANLRRIPSPARREGRAEIPRRASWLGCWSGSSRSPAGRTARGRRVAADRRLVARRELPLRRPDLPARQSAAARAAGRRARQAAPARPLGHDAGAQSHLRAPESRHPRARPRRPLRDGTGSRRPGVVANAYLEGTYSELYAQIGARRAGAAAAVPPVLVPGRHPEPRGTRDARLDPRGRRAGLCARSCLRRGLRQPRALVACVIGDGEAETGPLAASWHSNKFLDPVRDGAVLPILHLNGYKIASPTVLARIPEHELGPCSRVTAGAR